MRLARWLASDVRRRRALRAAVSNATRPVLLRGLKLDTALHGCGSLHADARCVLRQPPRRVCGGGGQLRHLRCRQAVRC
jgi:hypothetical protein